MIRFILTALSVLLFLILGSPIMLYLLWLKKKNPKRASKIAQSIVAGMFKFIMLISGAKISIKGLENLTDDTYLFVSNHRGAYDILLAYIYTPRIFGFISKKEIKKIPLLRTWMYLVNCKFLDRDNIKEGMKTILECIDTLKAGTSLWICPEGTRCKNDSELDMLEFKEGAIKPAIKAKVKIVPVAISGTANLFEKNNYRVIPHNLSIEYAKPIDINELSPEDKKQAASYIRNIILEMLKNNGK